MCLQDDAAAAKWYPVNSLPSLAFDHKQIIREAFQKLLGRPEVQQAGACQRCGASAWARCCIPINRCAHCSCCIKNGILAVPSICLHAMVTAACPIQPRQVQQAGVRQHCGTSAWACYCIGQAAVNCACNDLCECARHCSGSVANAARAVCTLISCSWDVQCCRFLRLQASYDLCACRRQMMH
jgi:hypothetical protein